jgi:hypothetical protein
VVGRFGARAARDAELERRLSEYGVRQDASE